MDLLRVNIVKTQGPTQASACAELIPNQAARGHQNREGHEFHKPALSEVEGCRTNSKDDERVGTAQLQLAHASPIVAPLGLSIIFARCVTAEAVT
jgi:hypothetical protein